MPSGYGHLDRENAKFGTRVTLNEDGTLTVL